MPEGRRRGTDLDLAQYFELGYFRDAEESASVFILQLNPILNKILDMAGQQLTRSPAERVRGLLEVKEALHRADSRGGVDSQPGALKGIESFKVEFRDEALHRVVVETTEEPDADLPAIVKDASFQKVSVTQSNGKTRRLTREVS